MRTTFLNGDQAFKERGIKHLEQTAEDLTFYMNYEGCEDIDELIQQLRDEDADFRTARQVIRQFEDLSAFNEYALGYDYVELGTWPDQGEDEDYFRYQMSWGGPSDELRFYPDGTIEWEFNGKAFRDRPFELMVTSRVQAVRSND